MGVGIGRCRWGGREEFWVGRRGGAGVFALNENENENELNGLEALALGCFAIVSTWRTYCTYNINFLSLMSPVLVFLFRSACHGMT